MFLPTQVFCCFQGWKQNSPLKLLGRCKNCLFHSQQCWLSMTIRVRGTSPKVPKSKHRKNCECCLCIVWSLCIVYIVCFVCIVCTVCIVCFVCIVYFVCIVCTLCCALSTLSVSSLKRLFLIFFKYYDHQGWHHVKGHALGFPNMYKTWVWKWFNP